MSGCRHPGCNVRYTGPAGRDEHERREHRFCTCGRAFEQRGWCVHAGHARRGRFEHPQPVPARWRELTRGSVPAVRSGACRWCGAPARFAGTNECGPCHALFSAVGKRPEAARRMLRELGT